MEIYFMKLNKFFEKIINFLNKITNNFLHSRIYGNTNTFHMLKVMKSPI